MYSYEKNINNVNIYLNVYDLHEVNDCLWNIGLGFYYSGIEIYNNEYGYISIQGICTDKPKSLKKIKFREAVLLGTTNKSVDEIKNIINDLKNEFPVEEYHPIYNNHNNFTNELSRILTGNNIPDYVNRMSYLGICISKVIAKKIYLVYKSKNVNEDPEEEPFINDNDIEKNDIENQIDINNNIEENIEENIKDIKSNNKENNIKLQNMLNSYTLV